MWSSALHCACFVCQWKAQIHTWAWGELVDASRHLLWHFLTQKNSRESRLRNDSQHPFVYKACHVNMLDDRLDARGRASRAGFRLNIGKRHETAVCCESDVSIASARYVKIHLQRARSRPPHQRQASAASAALIWAVETKRKAVNLLLATPSGLQMNSSRIVPE